MQRVAVFARDRKCHFEAACAVNDSSQLITFQSPVRWVKAAELLRQRETVKVYFAPIGSGLKIGYEATLREIDLAPAGDARLLRFQLPIAANEGLWGKSKTLYAVSDFRRCRERLLSTLQKTDGTPLSDDFAFIYALVLESDGGVLAELHPEEIPEGAIYAEGAVRQVAVNAYERNPAARQACISYYGTDCAVCGFNFFTTYGSIGAGFIHVHHLELLASIREGYSVDPINDLRPVCPNCHAMIHRKDPPFLVEELRARTMALSSQDDST